MTRRKNSRILVAALALAATLAVAIGMAGQASKSIADSQAEIEKIVALLEADSFLEAAKPADALLAGGKVEAGAEAICGLAVLASGRIEAAKKILLHAVAREPENPEAHYGLGRLARIRNDSEAAVEHLRRGIESRRFYKQVCRQLWRTVYGRGMMAEIKEISGLVTARFRREGYPAPDWLANNLAHEVEKMQQQLRNQQQGGAEVARLQAEIQELRQAVRQLNARLDAQKHDQR